MATRQASPSPTLGLLSLGLVVAVLAVAGHLGILTGGRTDDSTAKLEVTWPRNVALSNVFITYHVGRAGHPVPPPPRGEPQTNGYLKWAVEVPYHDGVHLDISVSEKTTSGQDLLAPGHLMSCLITVDGKPVAHDDHEREATCQYQ